ncbi:MAG TPA: L,D-transpeptidase family protein [Gaiellaceae bacterium]
MTSSMLTLRHRSAIALAIAGVTVLAPGAATPAKTDAVVTWTGTTPSEGAVLGVAAKTQLTFQLGASTETPGVVLKIREASGSPQGAVLRHTDGNAARATYAWTPSASQVGEYHVTFTASTDLPVGSASRTIVIRVGRANKPPPGPPPPPGVYPQRLLLSDRASETYRWAFVRHRTVARTGPSRSARAIAAITFRTPELYRNAIQVLNGIRYRNGKTWVRIRLTVLPNGTTGWVPRGALAGFQAIHTRMVIVQRALRATLYRRGRPIFSAPVGVGQPQWPTPRGEFYVREKLSGYSAPAYGPRAFGLNARSTKLTDWPGGGFIGIHGTDAPQILPGRVSHGCVRMRNPAILRLFRLMPLGTPVSIR